mmetsp:Transcript_28065/g.50688  ORF Transcript_28065/g.50688 Transcript_28065/m.50688 type:complete len:120 (+) Transcript_28065:100-459(+)
MGQVICPECTNEQCGCKCGESICFIGAFVFVAACAFWLFGEAIGWNQYRPNAEDSFHQFNIWWFHLSFLLMVAGVIYAVAMRGKEAFAREAEEEIADGETENGEASAPTPYIMLDGEAA